jgi:hypothetical protein
MLFFRNVAYIMYDVKLFIDWLDFKKKALDFFNGSTALVGLGRYFGFLIYLRAVELLGRVISSSQGFYLNTRQHKHRKTHIHTIKHPCPRRDSNP